MEFETIIYEKEDGLTYIGLINAGDMTAGLQENIARIMKAASDETFEIVNNKGLIEVWSLDNIEVSIRNSGDRQSTMQYSVVTQNGPSKEYDYTVTDEIEESGNSITVSKTTEALKVYDEYQALAEENKIIPTAVYALRLKGFIHTESGNPEKGLEFYEKAGELVLKSDLPERLQKMHIYYTGVTKLYALSAMKDFDAAAVEAEKCKKMLENIKNLDEVQNFHTMLGYHEIMKGDYDKALQYYEQGLQYSEKYAIPLGSARALTDIGKVYQKLQRYNEAEDYHKRSLQFFDQFENKEIKAIVYLNLGSLFFEQKAYDQAQKHLECALKIIDKTQAKPTASLIHQAIAELFEEQKEYQKALQHLKAFQRLKEEVFSEESSLKLKNLQIRMEVQRAEKESEINRLKYVELANMQAQLVQTEKMALLGNLVAGLAHEINTPLGVITSNTDLSQRTLERIADELKSVDIPEKAKKFKALDILINNNRASTAAGRKIIDLINNLKNFSRLDQADFQLANIHEGIDNTLLLIASQIPQGITIVKHFGDLPLIECYPQELNQVFMTLFINAIEAVDQKGRIGIETKNMDGHIDIRIFDSGKGIPPDVLDKIFEIGFTTHKSKIKMNVGLANSYNIIQKHNGQIQVTSETGKGTVFRIQLPLRQEQ